MPSHPSNLPVPNPRFVSDENTIRILTLYDNELAQRRARHLQTTLGTWLSRDFGLMFYAWPLHLLRHPKMIRLASAVAQHADLVLFVLNATPRLSRTTQQWLARSLILHDPAEGGLLGILETGCGVLHPPSEARQFLRDLAGRTGLHFAANHDGNACSLLGPLAEDTPVLAPS